MKDERVWRRGRGGSAWGGFLRGFLIALGAVIRLASVMEGAAFQAVIDPSYAERVRESRREITAFDRSGKGKVGDVQDPRRRWADYFWTYYEQHGDISEGSQAAGRALRLLAELKDYQGILKKSRDLDPQNPAWAYGGIQALAEASEGLDRFHDFFETAEGLIGVTLDPNVRDATRLALASLYLGQGHYEKAKPLLRAILAQSSDPGMLRAARQALYAFPDPQSGQVPTRDGWQMPQRVFSSLGIGRGSVVADIGAGEGYFAFRLAEAVQPAGKVYAVEIDPKMIELLETESRQRGLKNVRVLRGADADPRLPKSSCDAILFVDAYHEVQDRPAMLRQVKRALKARGRLAILDNGPTLDEYHFLREETVLAEVTGAGFKLDRKETFLPTQFMLVFRK